LYRTDIIIRQQCGNWKCQVQIQNRLAKRRPTKRALDGWESAPFSGFIYTQAESCSRSFVHARLVVEPVETHPQVTQAVGLHISFQI